MLCERCGNYIKDGERFCPKCGTVQEKFMPDMSGYYMPTQGYEQPAPEMPNGIAAQNTKKERKKMSKGKKAKIICIAVAVFILALIFSAVTVYFTSPAYKVYKDLEDGNYKSAVREFSQNVDDDFFQEILIKIALDNYAEKTVQKYKDGKIDFEEACKILEALKEMKFEQVPELLDEINSANDVKETLDQADKFYDDGDFENAIKEYSKIPENSENYSEALKKLNELYPKYVQKIKEEAELLISNGEYQQALSLINIAFGIVPSNNSEVSKLVELKAGCLSSYKQEVLDEITQLVNDEKYLEAISAADAAIAIDDNEDFRNAKATAEEKYAEKVTETVNGFLAEEDYISAKRAVAKALSDLPNNSTLQSLKTNVEKATPIYLLDVCKPYASDNYTEYVNGEKFTMGGNEYTNGFSLYTRYEGYAIFNLNSKYSVLNFYLGHLDGARMERATVKVYFDDILKEEYVVEGGSLPKKIELNVTGVKQVKIISNGDYTMSGFGNVTVK